MLVKFHMTWGKNPEEEFIMKMRKGFTLVELLIVIIIIGILAAAMLLSSGAASDSAAATKALSEMRSLKAAVISYAAEKGGDIGNTLDAANYKNTLKGYMDKDDVLEDYDFAFVSASGSVDIKPNKLTPTALEKLTKNSAVESDGTMTFRIPRVK